MPSCATGGVPSGSSSPSPIHRPMPWRGSAISKLLVNSVKLPPVSVAAPAPLALAPPAGLAPPLVRDPEPAVASEPPSPLERAPEPAVASEPEAPVAREPCSASPPHATSDSSDRPKAAGARVPRPTSVTGTTHHVRISLILPDGDVRRNATTSAHLR